MKTVENLIEKYLNIIFEKIAPEKECPENTPLINLYRQAEDYFFRGISSKCLDLDDGANAYMTGGAGLNFIYITRNTKILDKILIKGKQFYDQDNLSFEVIIPQKLCSPQIVGILNTLGYPQKSKSVSMVINLDAFTIDKTASFDAEAVIKANDNKLNDWMMPLIGAFESTFDICSIYANVHKKALKRNINLLHFSLYKQDKPIASITLSMNNNIARIDDVGTLPEFQGKGYATHLMRYVLSEVKRLGARHCFLESSDSGLGVYQKLGFEPLFKNNIYSRQA
ncbi:GNAT family N-acetyltransferase [Legionella septentrionalis]|uniref:GNAT family N-acetyltransferase n=2 Tax=Legionella septentrionalis TaxID=2498109 RepID=A0A433JGY9_9GAMM|nr:GNAT family N-acetyltransferase [Legionella septentrionalis]